jgi:hypothetical protein
VTDLLVTGGFYTFTKQFKYLGSIISWDLKADADIAARLRSATGAFAQLKNVLTDKCTALKERAHIYSTIVVCILLFGGENWAVREDLLKKLENFHNQCLRYMCHVTKKRQWKKKITTKSLNSRAGVTGIREMLAIKQLRWFGHIVRMENTRAPKMLLACWVPGVKRASGRPYQHIGHSIKKFLKLRAKQLIKKDINFTFIFTMTDGSMRFLTPTTLATATRKTSGVKKNNEFTCVDLPEDRLLWKQIVSNKYYKLGLPGGSKRSRRTFRAQTNGDATNTAYGRQDLQVTHAIAITADSPCPHNYMEPMLYGVWGVDMRGKRAVCMNILSSWEDVIEACLVIKASLGIHPKTYIKQAPSSVFNKNFIGSFLRTQQKREFDRVAAHERKRRTLAQINEEQELEAQQQELEAQQEHDLYAQNPQ